MAQRMFQDVAGTIPAILPGQAVGLARRLAGSVDALQATALSRPALGRWPMGAPARNLLRSSDDISSTIWRIEAPSTKNGNGVVFAGAGSASVPGNRLLQTVDGIKRMAGEKFVLSWKVPAASDWSDPDAILTFSYGGGGIGPTSRAVTIADAGKWVAVTATVGADGNWVGVIVIADRAVTLQNVRGFQLERGDVATPYQPTDADGVPLPGYGQVRNLAVCGSDFNNISAWRNSHTSNGLTFTKLAVGSDANGNYADFSAVGAATNNWSGIVYNFAAVAARPSAQVGDEFVAHCKLAVLSGSLRAGAGLAVEVSGVTSTGTYKEGTHSIPYSGSVPDTQVYSHEMLNPETALASTSISLRGLQNGDAVDIVFRVYDLQFERGLTPTPLQFNFGPNNITEPGVPDVWFLHNDGGDSLPTETLPAGTYGIAWANVAGGVTFSTQTLAAPAAIAGLRGIRTADVVIRQGAFTAREMALIEAEWSKFAT